MQNSPENIALPNAINHFAGSLEAAITIDVAASTHIAVVNPYLDACSFISLLSMLRVQKMLLWDLGLGRHHQAVSP